MNKDTINLIKDSGSTVLINIAQMAQYRVRYVQKGDAGDKVKMYEHAFFSIVGILSLLTIGVLGLMESRRSDYLILV